MYIYMYICMNIYLPNIFSVSSILYEDGHNYPVMYGTVPTLNSCTKCVGNPGTIHDCMPGCHQVSLAWL